MYVCLLFLMFASYFLCHFKVKVVNFEEGTALWNYLSHKSKLGKGKKQGRGC